MRIGKIVNFYGGLHVKMLDDMPRLRERYGDE